MLNALWSGIEKWQVTVKCSLGQDEAFSLIECCERCRKGVRSASLCSVLVTTRWRKVWQERREEASERDTSVYHSEVNKCKAKEGISVNQKETFGRKSGKAGGNVCSYSLFLTMGVKEWKRSNRRFGKTRGIPVPVLKFCYNTFKTDTWRKRLQEGRKKDMSGFSLCCDAGKTSRVTL